MHTTAFQNIVNQMVQEQGGGIFENPRQCRGLLADYAKGKYKQEIRLFLIALEGGCYHALRQNPGTDIPRLIAALAENHGIHPAEAAESVALMAQVLEHTALANPAAEEEVSPEIDRLERVARKGDCRAMYELGLVLEKLTWFEESNYWFKRAALAGLRVVEALQKPSSPESQTVISIPDGAFLMGSPITEPGWSPAETQHHVHISRFCLGKYTVTQREYARIVGTNPSCFKGDTLPVENVTWFEAAAYCNALSLREKRTPAYTIQRQQVTWNRNTTGYRLPTEAEWEYACRAGSTTAYYTGPRITTEQANYNGAPERGQYRKQTTPVGTFPPNPWGLYDMCGNVWEWCWDRYGPYGIAIQRNPWGPAEGTNRVIRGGSWNYPARSLRSGARNSDNPACRTSSVGFRLALPAER